MAKKPKALENVSNRVILIGSVVAAIVAIVGGLTMLGVPLPLTEKSPVIQEFVEFDEVHDLEIEILKTKQKAIIRKDLLDSISSTKSLMSQFDRRTDLNDVEREFLGDWEADIIDYTEQLKEMRGGKE